MKTVLVGMLACLSCIAQPISTRLQDLSDVKLSTNRTPGLALIQATNVSGGRYWTNGTASGSSGSGGGGTNSVNTTNVFPFNLQNTASVTWGVSGSNVTATAVGSDPAAPINNFYATNVFYQSGKGNTLVITQTLTVSGQYVYPLVAGTGITFTTNNIGTGQTNITIAASGGGGTASTWIPNTALAYSGGTNLTIDGSGGTNFYVLLTNTAFFATPSNIPASKSTNTSFTVYFQQDSTGTRAVTWTNASFKFPGGNPFQPTTNANAVSWVSFTMSPFTNGVFMSDYGVYDSR